MTKLTIILRKWKKNKNDCDISRFETIIELQLSCCITVCDVGQEFFPKRYASCEMHVTNPNKGRPLGLEQIYKFAPWALGRNEGSLLYCNTFRHCNNLICCTLNVAFQLILQQCCKTSFSFLLYVLL